MTNTVWRPEMKIMVYPLVQHEGHLLIAVEGRYWLIDTGSPQSFGKGTLRLAERTFQLSPSDNVGNTPASISKLVGTPLDGLLGMDILGEFDLEISVKDATFRLSQALIFFESALTIRSVLGVPLFRCDVAGKPANLLFDTGAPLAYISEDYLEGALALGEADDFHPLLGRFTVATFMVPVTVQGHKLELRAAHMPSIDTCLMQAGAQGILGTQVLQDRVLKLSSRQSKVAFVHQREESVSAENEKPSQRYRRKSSSISDCPHRLRDLTDVEKAAVISDGLAQVAGGKFQVEVDSVRYRCVFHGQGDFREPAELRITASSADEVDILRLKAQPDSKIERAIADRLSKAADESYRVNLLEKRYSRERVRITVQLSRA